MERKKKVLFIVNPVSGTGDKHLILKEIEQKMNRDKFEWHTACTAYAGHGSVLAASAAENGIDIVVAIGGDGTVNEIARSLVHTPTALGIIPCGSGNGLARHLRIPLDYRKAIDILNNEVIHPLDYGTINRRPFFCTCGMGFDAAISYKFATSIHRGMLSYLENTLKEITHFRPETYIIEDAAGKISTKAFLLTCANASQWGNNAYIAPGASMSDGLMDITLIEPFTALEAPQLAYQLFNGTLHEGGKIKMLRSRSIHITREHPGVIHCDGEPFKAEREIEVVMHHHGLCALFESEAAGRPGNLLQTIAEAFSYFVVKRNSALGDSFKQINKELFGKLKRLMTYE